MAAPSFCPTLSQGRHFVCPVSSWIGLSIFRINKPDSDLLASALF